MPEQSRNTAPFTALSFSEGDALALVDFVDSWDDHGGPVLFVGSGLSRSETVRKAGVAEDVRIANWEELIREFQAALAGDGSEVDGMTPQDYLDIPQAYTDSNGRLRLVDKLKRAIPYKKFDPGNAYRSLCRFQWASVLTTNYDDFLERAFEGNGRSVCKIVNVRDLTSARDSGAIEVIKIHGCLEADPDFIVLSSGDYKNYEASRAALAGKVRLLLLQHPTLFVGFSLTDPNVEGMLKWVRDNSQGYKLPSIALVHTESDLLRKQYWAEHGVKLVRLPSGQSVQGFLDAFYQVWRPAEQPPRSHSVLSELMHALDARDDGWIEHAVAIVTKMVASQDEEQQGAAARHVFWGGWHDLSTSQIREIISNIDVSNRRSLYLAACRCGIVSGGGQKDLVIDIEQALLDDSELPVHQRGEVLILRAERSEKNGAITEAKADLEMARSLCASAQWAPGVQGRLRRLLLRLGDASLIESSLLEPPNSQDSFDCARRGADLLMTKGRTDALRWYRQAHDAAVNGDQKTAALLGLQLCSEPGKWKDLSEFDPTWPSIRDGNRPLVDEVIASENEAGKELVKSLREGSSVDESRASQALGHLKQALIQVDNMGWPRSPSPNFTGHADAIALAAVGLLLRKGASWEQVKEGLVLFVERGLHSVHSRVVALDIDLLFDTPEALAWTRDFIRHRDEALYMGQSRDLIASALIQALPDAEANLHFKRVVNVDGLTRRTVETARTELHLALLWRQYHALSSETASAVITMISQIVGNNGLPMHSHEKWLRLPVWDWIKTGVIEPTHAAVQSFTQNLIRQRLEPDDGVTANDRVLRFVDDLRNADAILPNDQQALVDALDQSIARLTESDEHVSSLLTLIRARQGIEHTRPSAAVLEKFPAMYKQLRNSSVAGTWVNVLDMVGRYLPAEAKKECACHVEDYLTFVLSTEQQWGIPSPEWAATAISQGALGGIIDGSQAWDMMKRLVNKHPDCIVFAPNLPGADFAAAQSILLTGLANGSIDDEALHRWCVWAPEGSPPSSELEYALGGLLFSSDANKRRVGYWSMGWLVRNKSISNDGMQILRKAIFEYGIGDRAWKARSAAVVALAGLPQLATEPSRAEIVERAEQDPIASVRRAAGFLKRTMTHGLPKRGS